MWKLHTPSAPESINGSHWSMKSCFSSSVVFPGKWLLIWIYGWVTLMLNASSWQQFGYYSAANQPTTCTFHCIPGANVFQGILSRSSTLLHTLTIVFPTAWCLFSQLFAWNFNKSNFSHLSANPSSFHAASWREIMAQPWQTGACQWEASQRAVPLTKAPGTKNSE